MDESWLNRWNERYSNAEYAFGEEPNLYLEETLKTLSPGSVLFAAEGEGRNAVFAAKLGWSVCAFDISEEGKKKALRLAVKNEVAIDYRVGELDSLGFLPQTFDTIALIYAHFPAAIKSEYHKKLNLLLRVGGTVIFEAFSKKHIDYVTKDESVGGPRELAMLFSVEEIEADFPNYEILELQEREVDLREGKFHNGKGSVLRFFGRKKTLP
ncbi:class I SAM-dependent methyltransferase [Leptospira gomenensis]|uniref:Class I SAM-dependent methyltransferase n=1 Tax=Leptospira gomenensis TaxID=2484974 RepID=A0A5F1Y9G0_9LEPT|nr:class I SAM-dependent methyltransferase [Leptospira gomenensis]TGK31119.1 class I SAM-dependent methyltransferase [Leptospira gomenensis]TGK43323.1 class I SAM-dependent methyltransferase [Leptospira gomenensis]TGK45162.1 class I SAM-dependent methyltransferase [Leptospira gomenensis]TGK66076.1 class I SAM-dependent methyltransferase [Leptospira gomenensis]